MGLSGAQFLKNTFNQAASVGDKIISSDAMLVIDGYESLSFLVRNFPMPVLSAGEAIEIPMPAGIKLGQKSQAKVNQQGGVTIMETLEGSAEEALRKMISCGGVFDAKIYEGTKDAFYRYHVINRCFFTLEPGERDWENTTGVFTHTGTLNYHYFGETVKGNLSDTGMNSILGPNECG